MATIARVILLLGFAVLAIDSIYFSVWFTAKDETSRTYLFTNLMQSEYLIIPKVGLLTDAIVVLYLAWRQRIKEIEKETENLRKISASYCHGCHGQPISEPRGGSEQHSGKGAGGDEDRDGRNSSGE